MSQKKNNVIILNGPSSSGKTTTLNTLQKKAQDIWLSWGVDVLWNSLVHTTHLCYDLKNPNYDPQKVLFGFSVEKKQDYILREQIMFENGKNIMVHMSECVNVLSKSYNLVVGDVIYPYKNDPNYTMNCYIEHLNLEESNIFFFGIDCDNQELVKREKLRNGFFTKNNGEEVTEVEQGECRPEGLALQQKAIVHENKIYDLMLDSTNLSPDQLVNIMFNFVNSHEPKALKIMRNLLCNNEAIGKTQILNQM